MRHPRAAANACNVHESQCLRLRRAATEQCGGPILGSYVGARDTHGAGSLLKKDVRQLSSLPRQAAPVYEDTTC